MKIVGLMSGTSMDGVTAALVDIRRARSRAVVKVLHFRTYPYSMKIVRLIREASDPATGTVDKVARLNFLLGEIFSEAALSIISSAGLKACEVSLIGSHGQTIQHLPGYIKLGGRKVRATMQIGEPAVIAARTGITTVADFRPGDIAAGGQGAPLVPYADYLLFSHPKKSRLILNIGGIANVTYLPAGAANLKRVLASDTGPGNMVIDELVRMMSKGRKSYDDAGALAASGDVDARLLEELLKNEFFRRSPPRSCGREEFGPALARDLVNKARPKGARQWGNLIATATALTVESIHGFFLNYVSARKKPDELIVSGGGVKNMTMMNALAHRFSPAALVFSDYYGIPAEAKEGAAFALLAYETFHGRPSNVPGATGAKKPAILGKIIPAGASLKGGTYR